MTVCSAGAMRSELRGERAFDSVQVPPRPRRGSASAFFRRREMARVTRAVSHAALAFITFCACFCDCYAVISDQLPMIIDH